jgi:hypothetical protein
MGMNWHELRDAGHDRLHDAIAEAQRERFARRVEQANAGVGYQPGGIGHRAALHFRAGLGALVAECRRLAWLPRTAATR